MKALVHDGPRQVSVKDVPDDKLSTSRSPDDLPGYCEAILEALDRVDGAAGDAR